MPDQEFNNQTPTPSGQNSDLTSRFKSHPPSNDEVASHHEQVRAACHTLAQKVQEVVPPGREKSLALTKIEEAMMWANAGIARNQ